jgi:hypothetical protein
MKIVLFFIPAPFISNLLGIQALLPRSFSIKNSSTILAHRCEDFLEIPCKRYVNFSGNPQRQQICKEKAPAGQELL